MTADDLRAFEARVAEAFEAGKMRCPIHLSGGNEDQLLHIFKDVRQTDWVASTWRYHYHALLKGVPEEELMQHLLNGGGMNYHSRKYQFFTSAIVGGCLPIATGLAYALKRKQLWSKVHVFVGDMCASTGAFHDAVQYAYGHNLPMVFHIEDNGYSCDTPTAETWGISIQHPFPNVRRYHYERTTPHVGTGKFVSFV